MKFPHKIILGIFFILFSMAKLQIVYSMNENRNTQIKFTEIFNSVSNEQKEGWVLKKYNNIQVDGKNVRRFFGETYNVESGSIDPKDIQLVITNHINHFQVGDEQYRNIVMGQIEVVLEEKTWEEGKLETHYLSLVDWINDERGQPIIFQSGFTDPLLIPNGFSVINGKNQKIIDVVSKLEQLFSSGSSFISNQLFTKQKEEILQAQLRINMNMPGALFDNILENNTLTFAGCYGHSEEYLIEILSEEELKNQIMRVIRKYSKEGKIIAIIMHLHSYLDLCQRCSLSLSKWAERLSHTRDGQTFISNLLQDSDLGNKTVDSNAKFFIMGSSQKELTGRREIRIAPRKTYQFFQPLDVVTHDGPFLIQVDPKND